MFKSLSNTGIIQSKLNKKQMNKLKFFIKDKKDNWKSSLAGNISDSFYLEDKDNWFFDNVLIPLMKEYKIQDLIAFVPPVLTKHCQYVLHEMWVNYQNKYEFNPTHNHEGVFSFVVWVKIPSSYKKEKEIKFIKESNSPCSNTFEFIYNNFLGKICTERFHLEPEDEGTILLFPSNLLHQVYPFYLSDKKRISVSGNISLDPTKII
jgi:hypothetical protein